MTKSLLRRWQGDALDANSLGLLDAAGCFDVLEHAPDASARSRSSPEAVDPRPVAEFQNGEAPREAIASLSPSGPAPRRSTCDSKLLPHPIAFIIHPSASAAVLSHTVFELRPLPQQIASFEQ